MFSAQNRIFRNRSRRYSKPSAQLMTSLEPLKSSIQALFNGSKLAIATARGAENRNVQNWRKSQKKHEIAGVKKPKRDTTKEHCKSEETQNHNWKIAKNNLTKKAVGPCPHKKIRAMLRIFSLPSSKIHVFSRFFHFFQTNRHHSNNNQPIPCQ